MNDLGMTPEEEARQLADRKLECQGDVWVTLQPMLSRYGPVVLREQLWRWLEAAPRNRAEMEARP